MFLPKQGSVSFDYFLAPYHLPGHSQIPSTLPQSRVSAATVSDTMTPFGSGSIKQPLSASFSSSSASSSPSLYGDNDRSTESEYGLQSYKGDAHHLLLDLLLLICHRVIILQELTIPQYQQQHSCSHYYSIALRGRWHAWQGCLINRRSSLVISLAYPLSSPLFSVQISR